MVVMDLGEFLEYPSHPELAVKGSWSADRMRAEVKRLRAMGRLLLGHDPLCCLPLRAICQIAPTGALHMHLQGTLIGRIAPNPPDSCPGGALRATRPTSAAGRAALIKRPLHPYSRISGVFLNCGNGFPRVSPIVFRGEKNFLHFRRYALQGTAFPSSGDTVSPF